MDRRKLILREPAPERQKTNGSISKDDLEDSILPQDYDGN